MWWGWCIVTLRSTRLVHKLVQLLLTTKLDVNRQVHTKNLCSSIRLCPEVYMYIVRSLRKIGYYVHARILNTADFGVAHRRRRLYVIAIRKDSLARPFRWPDTESFPAAKLRALLDPPVPTDSAGRLPDNPRSKKLAVYAFNAARKKNVDPLRTPVSVDIDCSYTYQSYGVNTMNCLTAARGAAGGPWISTRGRRTTLNELVRCQGLKPSDVAWEHSGVSQTEMGRMLGNSMSVNVCIPVLREALWSAGLTSKLLS